MGEEGAPMDVDTPSSASDADELSELRPSSSSFSKDKFKSEASTSGRSLFFDDDDLSSSEDDDDQGGPFGGLTPELLTSFCKSASQCFFRKHGLVSHQINSYNYFVDVGLQEVFDSVGEFEVMPDYDPSKKGDGGWRYATVKFGRATVEKPMFWMGKKDVVDDVSGKSSGKMPVGSSKGGDENGNLRLLPKHARLMRMSYSGRLKVEISWEVYTQETSSSDKFKTGKDKITHKKILSNGKKDVIMGRIPVMLRSKLCWLSEEDGDECHFDVGGYFIIKGAEKTFIAQEERCMKRLWIDGGMVTFPSVIKRKRIYVKLETPKTEGVFERKTISVWFMYTTLPIWILFYALGASSDKEICEMIDIDINDPTMANILLSSIREADDKCENFRKGKFALRYIEQQIKETKIPPQEGPEECIKTCLFPALTGSKQKALFLAYMVRCLLLSSTGKQKCDDRDDYKFKRLDLAAELLSRQLRGHIFQVKKRMAKTMQRDVSADRLKSIECYVDAAIITNGLSRAFSTGAWNHSYRRMEKSSGIVASLRRSNPTQMVADLRKTRQQVAYTGMTGDARYPNLSYWGKICFISTPDNENCGLVKNLAVTGLVSTNSEEPTAECLIHCGMEQLPIEAVFIAKGNVKVFLNGTWVGICSDSGAFVKRMRHMRRRKLVDPQVEIKLDQQQGEVRIFSDGGRILRPLVIVKSLKKIKNLKDFSLELLMDEKIIELIGAEEEENCMIAPGLNKLMEHGVWQPSMQFTHCELDGSYLLSLSCGIIPFGNHNLAKRVLYQSEKHSQQAIGFSTTNSGTRIDTSSHQLYYPQIPLFRTMISECLGEPQCLKGFNDKVPRPEFFNGQNAVVAVNVYLGYNQEDSIVMNKASIERGMFRSEHIRNFKAEVDNKEAFDSRRYKAKDPVNFCKIESKFGGVGSLDGDGFPYVGANLESGDIIIGKAGESGNDCSIKLKHTERGKVQKVVLSANDEGKNFATVSLRQVRMPGLGDKFSSMHGQKGVIGFLEKQENFPFTKQGIVPDIVINPHAFPTRQTPGQLLEAALGKGIAMGGSVRSATPFSTPSVEIIAEQLHSAGFQRWGAEKFYDGRNGQSIDRIIFIGPNFYQRLVHMAEDKLKFRNTGPVHPLTRQPVADRKRFGGLKFGEMERDCLLAHGASANLHERLFTLSDYSHIYICRSCERVANVILRPLSDGTKVRGPYCRFCSSGEKIIKVNVPYGAKLLTQELFSMGICLKFGTEES